jgi:hypothetical protein
MTTIIRRTGKNGQTSYRAQVRRKGAPPLSATFTQLSKARKWVQVTEAAIVEGRHLKTIEAKHHTFANLIDHYLRASTTCDQTRHHTRCIDGFSYCFVVSSII